MRLIRSEVLELAGVDAMAFAQAQLMNDVQTLADGDWQWNGWLTPKGRLVAFFAVIRAAADRLLFWLPDGGADDLASGLRRYVFRSKVSLRADQQWSALGIVGPLTHSKDHALVLPFPAGADGATRHLVLVPADDGAFVSGEDIDEAAEARWRLADLALGVPYIAAGTPASGQFIPQWLSLQRLAAFSLAKGCYPGQEIVARMHYLGQSKRAAVHLTGDGPPPSPLAPIIDEAGQALGEIVWAQPAGGQWRALAALRALDSHNAVLSITGHGVVRTCEPLPTP